MNTLDPLTEAAQSPHFKDAILDAMDELSKAKQPDATPDVNPLTEQLTANEVPVVTEPPPPTPAPAQEPVPTTKEAEPTQPAETSPNPLVGTKVKGTPTQISFAKGGTIREVGADFITIRLPNSENDLTIRGKIYRNMLTYLNK